MEPQPNDLPHLEASTLSPFQQTLGEQLEHAITVGQALVVERKRTGQERFLFRFPASDGSGLTLVEMTPFDPFLRGIRRIAYLRYLDLIDSGAPELANGILEQCQRPRPIR